MVQTTLIQLTPTIIYGLNATPKLVLPAPPIGYVNNVLGISHDMTFNSAAYTTASSLIYGKANSGEAFIDSSVLGAISNHNLPASKGNSVQTIFSTTKDFFLTTDAVAATGDSNIDVHIIYEQIQLT